MFSEILRHPIGDNCESFGVFGMRDYPDGVIPATLAALFYPRGQEVEVVINDVMVDNYKDRAYLCFSNRTVFDITSEPTLFEYVELKDVNKFLEQNGIEAKVYICEEKKLAAVIGYTDVEVRHFILALTPRLFPAVFKEPVSDLEFKLLRSLSVKSGFVTFVETIDEITKDWNLREIIIRNSLEGFEVNFNRVKIEKVQREIEATRSHMENIMRQIASARSRIRELQAEENGYRMLSDSEENKNGLMNLFLSNPSIHLIQVLKDESVLDYSVKTHITAWDESLAETYIENRTSFLYDLDSNKIRSKDDKELLLNAIFLDRSIKIRAISGFRFIMGSDMDIRSFGGFDMSGEVTYIYHPHMSYNCLGDNPEVIQEHLNNGNYVGAVSQTLYAAQQLTVSDSTVMYRLTEHLFNDTPKRFCELPDGRCVTPTNALRWLKGELEDETNKDD